jgi:hypothetical protein
MITHIQNLFNLICFIYKFFIFTYIYSFFYNSCNIHKKIKVHGKSKIVHQPKSVLAIIYFVLLSLIFKNFTFGVVIFITMTLVLVGLIICDKFIYNINDKLKDINKHILVIFFWKIFHSVFTLIYMCTNGLNNLLNDYFKKKITYVKRIFNAIANLESTEKNNDCDNINKKLIKLNENNNDGSGMSEYIIKSKKVKSNTKNKDEPNNNYNDEKKGLESINNNDINIINNDIQKLINDIVNVKNDEDNIAQIADNIGSSNTNSKSIKDNLREKINNINNNVFGDSNEELEDIMATEISNIN